MAPGVAGLNSVVIAMNPKSGASDRSALVRRLEQELAANGLKTWTFTDVEQIQQHVAKLTEAQQLRAVVAAGGDGTVSMLVNRLPPQTPIAIFPLGTENLLAKYLSHTADPARMAQVIASGNTVTMDAAKANGRIFLIMAGCGFDADVVTRLHADRSSHIRHWSYAKPIFESIAQYSYPKIDIWVDDMPAPVEGRWAFVFNVPRYAMNLPIVPDADPMDGVLDLCKFKKGNLFFGLYYFASILTGLHRRSKEARVVRFRKLRMESVEGEVPYQLDGDPGGVLPLEIEVQPHFFRAVVSKEWAQKFKV